MGLVLLQKINIWKKWVIFLSDKNKFLQLRPVVTFDNTQKIKSVIQRRLLSLNNNNKISQINYDAIRTSCSYRPGLPKLHKLNVHLRPIPLMTNSPQHKLTKWCVKVLKPQGSFYTKHNTKYSCSLFLLKI